MFFILTKNWVNILSNEEWTCYTIFVQLLQHTATFQDLFAQSYESRPAFLRLVTYGIGRAVNWDVRAFMATSFLIVCGTSYLLYRLLQTAGNSSVRLIAWALMNFLLFQPAQCENWFIGFQLTFFLCSFFLILALFVDRSSLSFPSKILAIALIAVLSTFSFVDGLLVWVLAFPMHDYLRSNRPKNFRLWIGLYIFIALLTMSFYFADYQKPLVRPSHAFAFHYPLQGLTYFIYWVGNSLVFWRFRSACVVGCIMLLTFGFLGWKAVKLFKDRSQFCILYPWFCIGLYAIITGALITIGRSGYGVSQASSPRYINFSIYLPVAILGLFSHFGRPRKPLIYAFVLGVGFFLYAQSYQKALSVAIPNQRATRLKALEYLPNVDSDTYNPIFTSLCLGPALPPSCFQRQVHLFINAGIIPNYLAHRIPLSPEREFISQLMRTPWIGNVSTIEGDDHNGSFDEFKIDFNMLKVGGKVGLSCQSIVITATNAENQTYVLGTTDVEEHSTFHGKVFTMDVNEKLASGKWRIAAWAIGPAHDFFQLAKTHEFEFKPR